MIRLLAIIWTAVCLLCACQIAETPSLTSVSSDSKDSAAIYQDLAYQAMFTDSLGKAETYAYRAYLLSNDSTMENGTLALLCYIYYQEGKQEQMQLLMQTISPETYVNVMNVQLQVEQVRASRDRQFYIVTIILLLLISGAVCYWYIRKMQALSSIYQQRIDSVRHELLSRESSIPAATALPIEETKKGIDVQIGRAHV